MDCSFLHISVCTEEALVVFGPANKEGSIVSEEVLSIKTAQRTVDLMSGPIHCLNSQVETYASPQRQVVPPLILYICEFAL